MGMVKGRGEEERNREKAGFEREKAALVKVAEELHAELDQVKFIWPVILTLIGSIATMTMITTT